jgi:CBS domain-containing protein
MDTHVVRDAMTTDPFCCTPTDTTVTAARIMLDHDTGVVPVVEEGERPLIVGVVTDRDLCLGVVAQDSTPHAVQVESCMTTIVVSCAPDDPLDKAVALMQKNRIRRIPVVDNSGIIVGILSMADLIQRGEISEDETSNMLRRVSEPTNQPSKPRMEQYRKSA